MDLQSIDLINWTNYFKSNYKKGANRLETILDTPTLYNSMKQDLLPLTVLLSGIDGQSGYVAKAIQDRGKADELVEAYATLVYGSMDNFLALGAEKLALMTASYLSADAMGVILASEAGLSAMIGDEKALGLAALSATSRDAVMANSTALAEIKSTEDSCTKFIAGCAGLNPARYSTYASVMCGQTEMNALALSANALNFICKADDAMIAWMNSPAAHMFYDDVYSTLHNAPTSLFTKKETYYSKTYEARFDYGGASSNASGTWTNNGSSDWSHDAAIPFSGITLINQGGVYFGNSTAGIDFGSSLTKESIRIALGDTLSDLKLVCFGGANAFYTKTSGNSSNDNSCRGYVDVRYATYVPK
ncbi:MAG: hypothetical protein IJO87_10495 [Eggerthellaceae bacterium]|nr:hypothetical protein [Eggerthellaceae bacterium]